jgi:hypothetical protein
LDKRIVEVLDLMSAVENNGIPTGTFVDFLNIDERGYMLTIGPDHHRLLLGRGEFADRLKRYQAVRAEVTDNAVVDLRFSGQVFIREHE